MIVVDTNVVAGLYLPAEWSARCESLLDSDPNWAAPVLWRSELLNILAMYVRVGRVELSDALEAIESAEGLFVGREFSVASASVLQLAGDSGCTAYDCEFVAVAEHLGVPLVTLDEEILTAFPDIAVALERFQSDG